MKCFRVYSRLEWHTLTKTKERWCKTKLNLRIAYSHSFSLSLNNRRMGGLNGFVQCTSILANSAWGPVGYHLPWINSIFCAPRIFISSNIRLYGASHRECPNCSNIRSYSNVSRLDYQRCIAMVAKYSIKDLWFRPRNKEMFFCILRHCFIHIHDTRDHHGCTGWINLLSTIISPLHSTALCHSNEFIILYFLGALFLMFKGISFLITCNYLNLAHLTKVARPITDKNTQQ